MVNKKNVLQIFGDYTRRLRMQIGISQEELAELSCLHRTYISGVERGNRNISLVNIVRLAKALEITPSELLEGIK